MAADHPHHVTHGLQYDYHTDHSQSGVFLTGDFGLFYNVPLRSTYLRQATEIIDIYVYRMLQGGRMEVSTASSLLKSIIGMITVLSANALVRRIDSEKAMF